MRWELPVRTRKGKKMLPVIGIDVSKGKSEGQAFLSKNKPLGNSFSFEHTKQGLQELFQRLEDVEQMAGLKPYVILEATGHYHHPILTSLEDRGYVTIVLNPLTSQRSKKSNLRKVKTDAQDASHLAQLFYKEEFEPYKKRGEQLFNLRVLTRHHEAMTAMYVQLKLQFHAMLDQIFPLFAGTFYDLFSKTALEILRLYPTPQSVIEAGEEELTEQILALNVRSKSATWARGRAKKIVTAAQNSPRMTVYESHLFTLRETIGMLFRYQEHLSHLENEIDALARNIEEYDLLRSIPGIGEKIAATILSEIGDIDQFEHAKKLVAYAGIDPSVYASGKFVATSNKITKRGSKRLRRALFLAVQCGLRRGANRRLREFYDRKRSEGKAYKVALIACANKLLHVIFALLKNGKRYCDPLAVA
jgi:transposase